MYDFHKCGQNCFFFFLQNIIKYYLSNLINCCISSAFYMLNVLAINKTFPAVCYENIRALLQRLLRKKQSSEFFSLCYVSLDKKLNCNVARCLKCAGFMYNDKNYQISYVYERNSVNCQKQRTVRDHESCYIVNATI